MTVTGESVRRKKKSLRLTVNQPDSNCAYKKTKPFRLYRDVYGRNGFFVGFFFGDFLSFAFFSEDEGGKYEEGG